MSEQEKFGSEAEGKRVPPQQPPHTQLLTLETAGRIKNTHTHPNTDSQIEIDTHTL